MAKRNGNGSPDASRWPGAAMWSIDKIIPYDRNPRTHPDDQIALLADLMKRYGVDQPIVVDEGGVILKGHGRRLAAIKAGLAQYPVVQHKGLSEDDKRGMRIADNQVALLSGWNQELLRLEVGDLKLSGYDMPLLGFPSSMLTGLIESNPGTGMADDVPEPPKKAVTRLGDLWFLGARVKCPKCGKDTPLEDAVRQEKR